jgi:phage gp37-like protein
MSLETLRTGVVNKLNTSTPKSVHCDSHGGRFDLNELKRVSSKAPAAYVATLGFSNLKELSGTYEATVAWGVFVVAKDQRGAKRDQVALSIVDMLSLILPGNNWSLDESLGTPERIQADNLFSALIDKAGVAMWAITWRQHMELGRAMTEDELATLDLFATFDARFPIADDAPETKDQVSLPQDGV